MSNTTTTYLLLQGQGTEDSIDVKCSGHCEVGVFLLHQQIFLVWTHNEEISDEVSLSALCAWPSSRYDPQTSKGAKRRPCSPSTDTIIYQARETFVGLHARNGLRKCGVPDCPRMMLRLVLVARSARRLHFADSSL